MQISLRNRILLPSVGLIIVLAFGLSAVSLHLSQTAVRTNFNDRMAELSETSVRQVEVWIAGQRNNVEQVAAQSHVVKSLSANATTAERAVVMAELTSMYQRFGCFSVLNLADMNGDVQMSSSPDAVLRVNLKDRAYFQEASKTGHSVISQVLKSRTTGNPVVVVAVPVKDGDSQVGVLIASLDLPWFSTQIIDSIRLLDSGYAFFYDEGGVFLSNPNKELIMKAKLGDFEWGQAILGQTKGSLTYTQDGIERVACFTNSEKLGWGLMVTVPMGEMMAPVIRMRNWNILLGVGAVLVGLVVAYALARSIALPVRAISSQLSGCSNETLSAAGQVSKSSQDLAHGSTEQAASLEETSASLEEMSSMTKRNADHTTQAKELARTARESADAGAEDMRNMGLAMTDIKTSSDDIAKIIKTIDEIAFQTNILALNAAVEAARAGESGAGFAVVADEVRALAQRSASAARETAAQIEKAIGKTGLGVTLCDKVTGRLAEIVVKVREVDQLIGEVATASTEQTRGVDQINATIGQMSTVVQSNAATAEESAAAAEELNAQALSLNGIIATLQSLIEGGRKSDQSLKS
jgi:methyl-accepting chemotaxis protein